MFTRPTLARDPIGGGAGGRSIDPSRSIDPRDPARGSPAEGDRDPGRDRRRPTTTKSRKGTTRALSFSFIHSDEPPPPPPERRIV